MKFLCSRDSSLSLFNDYKKWRKSYVKISETRNVSGQVMIGEGENSKQVAYLNASVSKDGNVNINNPFRIAKHLKQIKKQS